jgi:uncharacterized membrane protein YbhN (UPF0104 family)
MDILNHNSGFIRVKFLILPILKTPELKISRRRLLVTGLIVLTVYVLLPQLTDFRSGWQVLNHLDLRWALLGVLFTALTYLAASATYCWLAFKQLPYWRTVEVQLAAMFVNRLLPAGLGAAGANYAYLRHMKHAASQAVSVVAVNNLLGGLGHGILTLLVLLVANDQVRTLNDGRVANGAVKLLGAVVLAGLAIAVVLGQRKWRSRLADTATQLLSYRRRPGRLIAALSSSMSLTAFNVLCLWASAQAAGLHLSLAVLFVIFTLGISLGTATPTPGGLGGFEAGLFAGLVAYNVPAGPALAVALLYRLISYWLALVVGAAAFAAAQRRHLFSTA